MYIQLLYIEFAFMQVCVVCMCVREREKIHWRFTVFQVLSKAFYWVNSFILGKKSLWKIYSIVPLFLHTERLRLSRVPELLSKSWDLNLRLLDFKDCRLNHQVVHFFFFPKDLHIALPPKSLIKWNNVCKVLSTVPGL